MEAVAAAAPDESSSPSPLDEPHEASSTPREPLLIVRRDLLAPPTESWWQDPASQERSDILDENPPPPPQDDDETPAEGEPTASDLAKKTQNPVADLISLPLQNNFFFDVGLDEIFEYLHFDVVFDEEEIDDDAEASRHFDERRLFRAEFGYTKTIKKEKQFSDTQTKREGEVPCEHVRY